jgi:hypothetical protein
MDELTICNPSSNFTTSTDKKETWYLVSEDRSYPCPSVRSVVKKLLKKFWPQKSTPCLDGLLVSFANSHSKSTRQIAPFHEHGPAEVKICDDR